MRLLVKNFSSILISLTLALLVWIAAVREQNPPLEDDYNQAIPIEVIPASPGLIATTPLPETLRLRLLAPASSWENLTPSKFKASIDLSTLDEGFNDVPILVAVSDSQVQIIDQIPDEASVNLEALQTITRSIEMEILDSPPLGYTYRNPAADPSVVDITGPASLIAQVDKAVTEIAIRNSKKTLEVLRDVLVRNREGQAIRGLTVKPEKVQVTLPIDQRFGYKDVSVRVQLQGQVAPGYRISNISVDPPTITVVGSPQGLGAIGGLVETAPINLDGATENIVRITPLNLPDGVTTVIAESGANNGPEGVKVTVEVTPIEDGINLSRPVTQQGIDSTYWWRAVPNQVDVFLSGPLTQLEQLRASDVEVIVNLFGLEPGVYTLQPTVFKPDALRVDTVLPDTVEVTIGINLDRLVTQRNLDPAYSWESAPPQVTLRLSGAADRLQSLGSVRVFVDLAGLGPGSYSLKPTVLLPEGVELNGISSEAIDVTIQEIVTPTITATRSVTVTATPSVTLTPSPTKTSTPQKGN